MFEAYYVVASLPSLEFEKEPAIKSETFLEECSKWMSSGEMRTLSSLDLNNGVLTAGDRGFIAEWKRFNGFLKSEVAAMRAARKDPAGDKVASVFRDIFDELTPLAMEKKLELKRWKFLDEWESEFHFDLNTLIIYSLKLKILERLAGFDAEKGMKRFNATCEAMTNG